MTIPREPGVYFSICKCWLHYPGFNRGEPSHGGIKVRLIRRPIGRKIGGGAEIMSCVLFVALAISYSSQVLLSPPPSLGSPPVSLAPRPTGSRTL